MHGLHNLGNLVQFEVYLLSAPAGDVLDSSLGIISNGMREGNVFTSVCPFLGWGTPWPGQRGEGVPEDGVPPCPGMGYPLARSGVT